MIEAKPPLRRSPATNGLLVLGILVVFILIGVTIWNYWSATNNRPEGDERRRARAAADRDQSGPEMGIRRVEEP